MASSAAWAAAGGNRTTKVQRCGGSGVADSGPDSGAPARALAFTAPATTARSRALVLFAAAAIAVSGTIGVYHAGVEARVFEGFTQCTATATGGSNAELLQQIIHAPVVRCDEVQFRFLGISMAGWNAILSLGGAALILLLALRRGRRA